MAAQSVEGFSAWGEVPSPINKGKRGRTGQQFSYAGRSGWNATPGGAGDTIEWDETETPAWRFRRASYLGKADINTFVRSEMNSSGMASEIASAM